MSYEHDPDAVLRLVPYLNPDQLVIEGLEVYDELGKIGTMGVVIPFPERPRLPDDYFDDHPDAA